MGKKGTPNTWTKGYTPSRQEIEREAQLIRLSWITKEPAKQLNNDWDKTPYYPRIYKTPNL